MTDNPNWTPEEKQAEVNRLIAEETARQKREQSRKRGNGSASTSSSRGESDGDGTLTNSRGGPPAANLDNAVTILESHPRLKNTIWFDEFLNKFMTEVPAREWGDADDLTVMLFMQRKCGLEKVGRETVCQALALVGHKDKRNCVRDWMQKLTWDYTPRIDSVFEDHFGTPATPYSGAVSKNFWLSMVARIYRPGCQVDNMIVLEGEQGTMKSSALRVIGGDWFCEQHESATKPKAFAEIIQGKLLVEISEMDSFNKADVTSIKQVITAVSDRYRDSYGKHASDHPRQCVFAGTTNRDDWNRDETGARRFWPIKCNGVIDCASLTRYREQYFAEAVHRYKAGESWWITPEVETKHEQQLRYDSDPWTDKVTEWLSGKSETTTAEILTECLKFATADIDQRAQKRVSGILRVTGWTATVRRSGRKLFRGWRIGDDV